MLAVFALLLAACDETGAGSGEVRSVYDVRIGERSAIHWTGDAASLEAVAVELANALENVRPTELSFEARIVLQNDVWGLASRIDELSMSSAVLDTVHDAALGLVRRLAEPADELVRASRWSPPPELGSGWREMGTELPVLSHERVFGLRRLFHLFHRGDERALVGRLVALDNEGRPHLASIASEIEILEIGSEGAVRARLFHLDRDKLASRARSFLREERVVAHVPGLSADRFFLELDPPEPIETLPCRRCHDDASENSLPLVVRDPDERRTALLRQVHAPWSTAAP